jgi:hypothetical protein
MPALDPGSDTGVAGMAEGSEVVPAIAAGSAPRHEVMDVGRWGAAAAAVGVGSEVIRPALSPSGAVTASARAGAAGLIGAFALAFALLGSG